MVVSTSVNGKINLIYKEYMRTVILRAGKPIAGVMTELCPVGCGAIEDVKRSENEE